MISAPIQRLVERLKNRTYSGAAAAHDAALINVNKLTERAGALYEKVRYMVDYKDERHIRRSAIERILRRKFFIERAPRVGLSLIQELIAGGYLGNNTILESVADDVERIVGKYVLLERYFPEGFASTPRARNAVVSLMGTEIEAFFYPNNEDDLVADALCDTVLEHVKTDSLLPAHEFETQVRIACYRSLLDTDDETLFYKLWQRSNPHWLTNPSETEIAEAGRQAPALFAAFRASLEHPFSFKLIPKLGNHAIYFSLIREVVRVYGAESERVFADHTLLHSFVREFLEKNYARQYRKARSASVRAIIYIFFTKVLLALALEIPYEFYILGGIQYFAIGTNIVFHPLLLLFMTFSVGRLGDENTKRIIAGVENVISGERVKPIKVASESTDIFSTFFYALYGVLFLAVFGGIIAFLVRIHFNVVSILLFLCFLALVSYFALRIRHSAKKWKVSKEEDRILTLLFNLFALPIVRAGKWLSRKFSSINLFVFILDFIIETPFKFLLRFSDSFVSFLKEKQEGVY